MRSNKLFYLPKLKMKTVLKLLLFVVLVVIIYWYLPLVYVKYLNVELAFYQNILLSIFLTGLCAALLRFDINLSSTEQDITLLEKTAQWFHRGKK